MRFDDVLIMAAGAYLLAMLFLQGCGKTLLT